MFYLLCFLFFISIYVTGIGLFPVLIRNYTPISNFVRDINRGRSYERYKECASYLSMFWPFTLFLVASTHMYKWFSDIIVNSTEDQSDEPVETIITTEDRLKFMYIASLDRDTAIESLNNQVNELRQTVIEIDNRTQPLTISEPSELFVSEWPSRSGQGWVLGDYQQAINSLRHFVEEEIVPRLEKLEKNGTV